MDADSWTDPIVEEVHRWRRELIAEAGGFDKYLDRLIQEQEKHKDRLVSFETITDDELNARIARVRAEKQKDVRLEKS